MIRLLLASFAVVMGTLLPARAAGEVDLERYNRVTIAPVSTSIYVGSVSLTLTPFTRKQGIYRADYVAKVFPYFFWSERGWLSIEMSDDDLRQLAKGEVVHFKGRGQNDDGEERRVEGRAVPGNADSGKIKVRVFVSKRIELIFNTTYRIGP